MSVKWDSSIISKVGYLNVIIFLYIPDIIYIHIESAEDISKNDYYLVPSVTALKI